MQRDRAPVEWPPSESKDLTEGSVLGRFLWKSTPNRQGERDGRAPSNMRGRGPGAWHFALPGKVTSGERRV